ncbi:hypothetical protein BGZ61DRAFT_532026 [Ilyonectria robusta]|uniref:uncharacterized protein n=1 Tax=Ilyonectria robusta TaxID=1079257 RepID=UPI001E8E3423|nr:uncharacterized protein BGZ61DRAFT_532026 [Ilyonectria robusta]KAH8699506.1 hypothetical protein BGZ61DRAFT_532026 [Ilyonectria robusta]
MSKSRLPILLGVGAASGVGYYLFQAGGDPRAAENKFESDAHRAAANVKSHLPGSTQTNAEKDLKGYGAQAGAKIDNAIAEADRQASIAKSNAEAFAKDAKADALKAVDKFDQKVEEGAAKAKGGISSWWGGSK